MSRYRTIVADPPWPFADFGKRTLSTASFWRDSAAMRKQSRTPYQQMSVEDIAALPVADIAEDDAHLYLWTINQHLEAAYGVVQAWGFGYPTVLTWAKAPRGLGFGGAYVNTTEFVLFARRGALPALTRMDSTWFNWRRPYENGVAKHSAKPDEFLDMVEQVSPGPHLELFARKARLGWDYWGDESLGTAEMAV